jgi:hypothetical protein
MINQYLVLQEIGHGTHGRVRLGRDMTTGEDGGYYVRSKLASLILGHQNRRPESQEETIDWLQESFSKDRWEDDERE